MVSPIPFENAFLCIRTPCPVTPPSSITFSEPEAIRARYGLRLVSDKVKRSSYRALFPKVRVKGLFWQTDDFIDPQNLHGNSGIRKPADGLDILETILVQNALAGHLRAF